MIEVSNLAKFIINFQREGEADLTLLKLQNLLYYCQGFFIAAYGAKLFDEPIEAWDQGPVVKSIHEEFKQANGDILRPDHDNPVELGLSDDQKSLLLEVLYEYGKYSAWMLREFTQAEQPWQAAYSQKESIELSMEDMSSFFKTQLTA